MDPMKILVPSIPGIGHLNPMLAVARVLMTEGHQVAVYTASAFRARVEASGAEFFALPPDADFDPNNQFERFPELKSIPPGLDWLRVAFERFFVDPIPAQHEGLQRLLRSFGPDVVLGDDMFFGVLPTLLGAATHCPLWHLDPALAAERRRAKLPRPAASVDT
jgi:Glycosyltransferase family 28 N-terminal domain